MSFIYAIFDNVANAVIGGLQIHKHDAPAIRMFADIANTKDTMVNRHPQDYDLIRLGTIADNGKIEDTERAVIMTGAAWWAAQQTTDEPQLSLAK